MTKILLAHNKKSGKERIEQWFIYTWDWEKMERTKRNLEDDGFLTLVFEVKE